MVMRESERSGDHCGFVLRINNSVGLWKNKEGHTIFKVPSHELEQNVSFATRFQ